MSSALNIILFGETGAGKSSVINLIAGRHVAETSPHTKPCTMSFKRHTFPGANGRDFHIWDTVGLGEAISEISGASGYLSAIEQACKLIQDLTSRGGVDLLLFCIRKDRATVTMQNNYRLFREALCGPEVPIALVITHLEWDDPMEDWWVDNYQHLERCGLRFVGHACVTGLPLHPKYKQSKTNLEKLLEGNNKGNFTMPPEEWYIRFFRLFNKYFVPKEKEKRKKIMKVLTTRCSMNQKTAESVVDMLV